jgi:S-adenosylmethionine:tRNA ribosyltransferase-isomerase
MSVVDFVLPAALEAHRPPEVRDGVRLLVSAPGRIEHRRFTDLPDVLQPGDVLVVNTSGTLPAAVPVRDTPFAVHFSTELDDGRWLVEPRGAAGRVLPLRGGGRLTLQERFGDRLWVARLDSPVVPYLLRHGRPIRYRYVPDEWPLADYQTVFATEPGSAEMPSAARPFTDRVVTRLVARGVLIVPVLLHTGVASAEAHERPYPERFRVPAATRHVIDHATGRVVAVGTTVVRALESAYEGRPDGWTDLVITPERGVRAVDGLLTGFHEPRASHLDMLAAVAGREPLDRCYAEALAEGYLWHEFGDVSLLLARP